MSKKFYRALAMTCFVLSLLIFAFLKFIQYNDIANHHDSFEQANGFYTYWRFFINWESFLALLISLIAGFLMYPIIWVFDKLLNKKQ